jgi:hypothetical protein
MGAFTARRVLSGNALTLWADSICRQVVALLFVRRIAAADQIKTESEIFRRSRTPRSVCYVSLSRQIGNFAQNFR